jgi:GT2 family glycosyltransferase
MSSPQISLVVPTYQRRESVRRLLEALEWQTIQPGVFEVLVVIDGSSDGTDDLIAATKASYPLRAICQPNLGRAAACNSGIRSAQGELVVLLDDDMEPGTGFLSAHWHAHQGQKRLGVVGAVPVVARPGSSSVSFYIEDKFRHHLEKLSQPDYQLNLRDFYSGNFSIRREHLLEVGLFDARFKIYGNEDLELSLRLRKAGISLVYCSDALAYQYYEKDFSALARDNIAKGKTAVLFARKFPEIYSEIKLGTYTETSRKWRFLRAGLLRLSRAWSRTPDYVIRFVATLERTRPVRLHLFYQFALDYFFWLGVQDAQ